MTTDIVSETSRQLKGRHGEKASRSVEWLERVIAQMRVIPLEQVLFAILLLAAVFTRFYDLESRVMSHDESLHTYYSWQYYQGFGYEHDPMMHGPFQFHALALSYLLFGDSDFTARIPAVLFGIASIAFIWFFRRWLGTAGTIAAAALFVISPYLLYYSRYVRNEAFVMLFGLITLWSIGRYMETRAPRYLFWLAAATALHFSTKETAFIYHAQAILFVVLLLLVSLTRNPWKRPDYRVFFIAALVLAAIFLGAAAGIYLFGDRIAEIGPESVLAPAVPDQGTATPEVSSETPSALTLLPIGLGVLALLLALLFLLFGYTLPALRQERALDLLLVLGTLVLPQVSALPVALLGWKIPDTPGAMYGMNATDLGHFILFIVPLTLIAVLIGLWWNAGVWLRLFGLFYGIFIALHTSLFTNPGGALSGLIGSLGYWLAQHDVQRGSQPWYYYLLVQVPIYEYLPFLASLLGLGLLIYAWAKRQPQPAAIISDNGAHDPGAQNVMLPLLAFWTLSSLAAYSIAGEKMPWLTVHIVLAMTLLGGWAIGQVITRIDWSVWRSRAGWLATLAVLALLVGSAAALGSLLGNTPPFAGKELPQLNATVRFLVAVAIVVLSAWGLRRLLPSWQPVRYIWLGSLGLAGILAVLTLRTAIQATYVNFDQANEYLVYAHGARGVKEVLAQVEEISQRTTDSAAVIVGYDDDTSWPMTWYLRNYPNSRYYGNTPNKGLREAAVIIVGDNNFSKIEPVVGQAYLMYENIRMVWPNQDYFGLTWERIGAALVNPEFRAALWQIWLNRDLTDYFAAYNQDIRLDNWSPSDRMRLYIRKDVAARIWEYGTGPLEAEIIADPYEGKQVSLDPDLLFGSKGSQSGQFTAPRDLAVAPDGSLYVLDSDNHRVQHFDASGNFLNAWGSFADILAGDAPAGTFNQPWGIAVGPDGSVYVSDTWNHRIQKFTAAGQFVTMWGFFGTGDNPLALWGPRDILVDPQGRVFVTDTGNKRVVIYTADGLPIGQFGGYGLEPGQFDEPVGLAVDSLGNLYVADTWNQRIQVFVETTPNEYSPLREWEIAGWYGQSLDNKPYLAVSPSGFIYVGDPEGWRVLEFDPLGSFVRYWGDPGSEAHQFGVVAGLATDGLGGLWVVDAANNRVVRYPIP